ncbi:hypothetical protein JOC77_002327 [Peribacillus deserti]|uniref:DUF2953 domain-containing protein n=1 Tax=Peribacillus deserti TaxID=673318 RepID=A0ABS2QI96_9BACI|nr:DUF2953 domain-containing protein [Peribacillus deserti]MBM7692896.1 hypothetical protein [Peribacillus deserti]
MIFLLVCIILLGIIIVFLFTKVRIHITYNQYQAPGQIHLTFRAWFGLLRYTKKVSFSGSKETKEDNLEKKKMRPAKEKRQSFIDAMRGGFSRKSGMIHALKKFLIKINIQELNWHSQIGTGNAAETAVLTGAAYGIKSTIIGVISQYLTFSKIPSYSVNSIYQGVTSKTRMNCIIEFRIGNAILTGLLLVKHWMLGRRKPAEKASSRAKDQSI